MPLHLPLSLQQEQEQEQLPASSELPLLPGASSLQESALVQCEQEQEQAQWQLQ